MTAKKVKYTESSGNVYQDLGFTDSEERLAKAKLAMRIDEIIQKKKYTQAQAAEILGINQPKVSALINGRLSGFSLEKLIHFLNLLQQDIEIIVKDKRARNKSQGYLNVVFA